MQKNHRKRTGRNRKRPRIIKPYERKQKREEDSVQLIPVEFGENGIEELGSNDAPLVEPVSDFDEPDIRELTMSNPQDRAFVEKVIEEHKKIPVRRVEKHSAKGLEGVVHEISKSLIKDLDLGILPQQTIQTLAYELGKWTKQDIKNTNDLQTALTEANKIGFSLLGKCTELGPELGWAIVDRILGKGGMGVVYSARLVENDQQVAIKTLLPKQQLPFVDEQQYQSLRNRFIQEAHILRKLTHPNIVKVYYVAELDDGTVMYVMDFLPRQLPKGRVDPRTAAYYVFQSASGLLAAHKAGVIHRDVKPDNIRADARNVIKVTDFGIAKLDSDLTKKYTLTATGTVMGTPLYASPEQLHDSKNVIEKTDVWSLGLVFYKLLTGRLPWGLERKDLNQIIAFHARLLEGDPDLLEQARPSIYSRDVPTTIDNLVACMLMPDQDERISMSSVVGVLNGYLRNDRRSTMILSRYAEKRERSIKELKRKKEAPKRFKRRVLAGIGTALAGLTLFFGLYFGKIQPERERRRLENAVITVVENAERDLKNKRYDSVLALEEEFKRKAKKARREGINVSRYKKEFKDLLEKARVGYFIQETYGKGLEHFNKKEYSKAIDLFQKFIAESADKPNLFNLHIKLEKAKEKLDQALIETLNEDYRFLNRTINRAEQDAKRVRLDELKEDLEQRQKAYRTFIQDTWEQVK
ncbi:hypothetical protein DRJ19_03320, partial [Candidatus Woesearchaeota archaeon]